MTQQGQTYTNENSDEVKLSVCQKNCKPKIDKNEIWKGDVFGRQTVADDFSKIITSINQDFVVSIDAPYGSGKSFFLERWNEELKKENITIFFNAWNCDFIEKPLVPFMYCFLSELEEQGKINKDQKEDIKNALNSLRNNILKAATAGAIDAKEMLSQQNYLTYGLTGVNLEEYQNIIDNLEIFKDKISEVVKETKKEGKNIYVFVDELERCRPTFAVELLESIKHLFDIDGLVFILGIDRSQLKSTISAIYGADMDGEGYLRRFIDLELKLPEPNKFHFITMLCENFKIKNKEARYCGSCVGGYDQFNEYFLLFSDIYKMSLREIEQCYTEFNVITKTIPENHLLVTPLLAFLLVIKYKNSVLYDKLGYEYRDLDTLLEIFKKEIEPKIKPDKNSAINNKWEKFLMVFLACFEKKGEMNYKAGKLTDELNEANNNSNKYIDKSEIEKKIKLLNEARTFLDFMNGQYMAHNINIFEHVKSKLSYINHNH